MSEEIKEIIDKLSNRRQETLIQGLRECQLKDIEHPFITKEEYIDKLLNYITNLQQKVKQLEKENDDLKNRLDNEVAENTLRIKEAEQLEKENKEIYETQKEYGCRILDACDFIEQRIRNKDFDYIKLSIDEIVYLLNILNKGSE